MGYRGLQGVTEGYKGVIGGYKELQGVTKGFRGLQGIRRSYNNNNNNNISFITK